MVVAVVVVVVVVTMTAFIIVVAWFDLAVLVPPWTCFCLLLCLFVKWSFCCCRSRWFRGRCPCGSRARQVHTLLVAYPAARWRGMDAVHTYSLCNLELSSALLRCNGSAMAAYCCESCHKCSDSCCVLQGELTTTTGSPTTTPACTDEPPAFFNGDCAAVSFLGLCVTLLDLSMCIYLCISVPPCP